MDTVQHDSLKDQDEVAGLQQDDTAEENPEGDSFDDYCADVDEYEPVVDVIEEEVIKKVILKVQALGLSFFLVLCYTHFFIRNLDQAKVLKVF